MKKRTTSFNPSIGEHKKMGRLTTTCFLTDCSYTAKFSKLACGPGGDSCTAAYLQTANESEFHDSPIRDATAIINDRLHKLAEKPPQPGLQLSFLWTPRGVMLAWVQHEETLQMDGVTRESGIEANDAALGIYPHPYHPESGQAS